MSERIGPDGKLQFDSQRSPCSDAHYEAFLIQSKWTVDNLYASNVNLGQDYVKRVKEMERQRKTWLAGKYKEQQGIEKRMHELQTAQRYGSLSAEKSQTYELHRRRPCVKLPMSRRHTSLERMPSLPKRPPKTRSVSQPCGPTKFAFNSLSENMEQLRLNSSTEGTQGRTPRRPRVNTTPAPTARSGKMSVYSEPGFALKRNTFSASTPSLRWRNSALEEAQPINTNLIPKYVPSKLRSRDSTFFR